MIRGGEGEKAEKREEGMGESEAQVRRQSGLKNKWAD